MRLSNGTEAGPHDGPVLYVSVDDREREYIRGEHCATAVSASEQLLREPLKVRFGHEVIFARFAIVAVCDRVPSAPQRRVEGDPYGVIRNTLQLRLALG